MREKREAAISWLCLVAFVLLAFWPTLTLRGVYFYGDASAYLPRLAWAGEQLREGHLPGWNPYLAMGTPVTFGFYPVDLAFFSTLPMEWAYSLDVLFHLLLAALGMRALARAFGQSPWAATLSGMGWSLGGFTIGHLQHFNILVAIAWLPLALLVVDRVTETPCRRRISTAAFVLGLGLLGGHVQLVLYMALALAAFAAVRLLALGRSQGFLRAAKTAFCLCGAAAGALALSSAFLLPFLEWSRFVSVGELFAPDYMLTWPRLVRLVAPFWLGGSRWRPLGSDALVEYSAYLGVLPLALAVLGLSRLTLRTWFLGGVAVLAILLSMGPHGWLWARVASWPFVSWGRTPVRFLVLLQFALALLAGFGLDAVRERVRGAQVLAALLVALSLGLLTACALKTLPPGMLLGRRDLVSLDQPDTIALLAALLGSAAALALLSEASPHPSRGVVLALALAGADLLFLQQNMAFNDLAPAGSYSMSATARLILSDASGPWRFFSREDVKRDRLLYSEEDFSTYLLLTREMISNALSLSFGVRSFLGSGGLEPPRLLRFKAAVDGPFRPRSVRLLALFGGRYVISRRPIEGLDLELVHEGAVRVYRNDAALPLAYFAARGAFVPTPEAAFRAILRADFDPRSTVVIEGSGAATQEEAAPQAEASILHETADRIVIEVTCLGPAWLVLNEAFTPGWVATIDKNPAPILRANFLVRTVFIPAGRHVVEFAYKPASRRIGGLLSLGSLLVLLLMRLPFASIPRTRAVSP